MSKSGIVAIVLSILVLTVGYYLDLKGQCNAFARSGSVLVVIGIVFASLSLKSRLNNVLLELVIIAMGYKSKFLQEIRDEGGDVESHDKLYDESVADLIEEAKTQIKPRAFKELIIEIGIVVIGTLVWGFGDLVV